VASACSTIPRCSGARSTSPAKNLFTNTGQEIWVADLTAGKVRRIAGQENLGAPRFGDGACAKARFANIHDLAVLKDGSLVVADNAGHALLHVTDPLDPAKCAVAYLAGTRKATDQVSYIKYGDKDGPAAEAMIGLPEWPVVDDGGNVYFVDGATGKIKQLAVDDSVTTIAQLPRDKVQTFRGMTLIGDKLYTIGNSVAAGFVHEVDTRTRARCARCWRRRGSRCPRSARTARCRCRRSRTTARTCSSRARATSGA
jgi:hypothetical protein